MIYPAFEAGELTGNILLKDRNLMELWKWAADEGQIQAIKVRGKNYAVVKDPDLAAKISAASLAIKQYRYDDEKEQLL